MSQRIAFRVHGQVQGVSYRYFTREKAGEYGLTGWVRNLSGGDVEGEIQGEESLVQKMLKDLEQGPPAARVERVERRDVQVMEVKKDEEGFEVRR